MKILYFGIYITKNENVNEVLPNGYKLTFSSADRLVFKPIANMATVVFTVDTFTSIDVEKLWVNIKEITQERYPEYDSIKLAIFLNPFLRHSDNIKNYIKSFGSLYEDELSDSYMIYDRVISEQFMDIEKSYMFKEYNKSLKKATKLPKVPKEQYSPKKSQVWNLYTEDQIKTLFGHNGYLMTSNKKALTADINTIKEFLNEFIPDNSKIAKKVREELLDRWIAVYVKYID